MSDDALPSWVPSGVDLDRPNAARVYDYYLGGSHNFEIDREFGKKALAIMPETAELARVNRSLMRRAVTFCAQQGVRQFLDLGAGIPTVGPTHEIARRIDPTCRVVYADHEAVAVAHSKLLLEGDELAVAVAGDVRQPESIVDAPEVVALLDFEQPVAVLAMLLMHFVSDDDDPAGILSTIRDRVAPGSYLIMSIGTLDGPERRVEGVAQHYQHSANPVTMRSKEEILELVAGWEIVEPGVVFMPFWRPEAAEDVEDHPAAYGAYALVARKP